MRAQGGPAHEGAVDVRNGHQLGGVGGLHAPPVEDPEGLGRLLVVEAGGDAPEVGVDGARHLGGGRLGAAEGKVITIDPDAAGRGWYVDPSPMDDIEFGRGCGGGSPFRGVDLLTVLIISPDSRSIR